MRTLQVAKDSTASIVTYPPFEAAYLFQASAAEVRIRTNDVELPAEDAAEACTIDSVDTTLSAAAERGDRQLSLTSGSGVSRQTYYLIEDNGDRYPVLVAEVSGNTAYLSEGLLNDISNGAAFKGIAITAPAFLATETASQGRRGLAKFSATLNGEAREWDHWFEVVPQVFPITLSPHRLARRGEVKRMRNLADVSLMDTILAAWEDTLMVKLRASGIYEETINTPTEVEPAHIEACILHLLRDTGADEERVADQEQRLDRVLSDVKASVKMRVDITEEDAAGTDERPHLAPWEVASLSR
jgi:hypothetical protein